MRQIRYTTRANDDVNSGSGSGSGSGNGNGNGKGVKVYLPYLPYL